MKNIVTILFLCFVTPLLGQEDIPLNVELIAGKTDKGVVLRWAPKNPRSWLNWNNSKVYLFRRPIDLETNKLLPMISLTDSITHWTYEDFERYESINENEDSLVMLVGYLLHSPYESTSEDITLQNMVDRKEELENRYSSALFAADMSGLAAEALGWRFEDFEFSGEQDAIYTMIIDWENGERTTKTIRYSEAKDEIPVPVLQRGKEEEGYVVLSWDKKFHSKHYTAYWIERSKDGKQFERLNKIPYIHGFDINDDSVKDDDYVYFDSIANYNPHYYRIVGISAFGIQSQPSNMLRLQGRDRTPPPAPKGVAAKMHNDSIMTIKWEIDPQDDIIGYVVQKDFAVDGNFDFSSVLLDTNSTTFEDNNPNYFAKNYYKVCAVDTAGNFGCSHPTYGFINDTIPPSNPVGISGKIDSNGVMTLSWEQNRERDLKGYNVYYSNSQDGVYSKLTSYAIRDTMYTDTLTLNTLTENIYYAITAEDIRDNVSNFSNRIQLEKPDTIPPGPSVFKEYNIKENGIELVWSPSYSRDAVTQQLWRSENVEKKQGIHS